MNEFRNLPEESEASKRAKQMGLVYKGFGRWADPQTGKVTHKTDNGQLVPIGQEKQHPGMTDPTKVAPGGKKRPNPGRPHPELGPPPARDIPQRGDDESEDDYYDRMAARQSSQDRGEMGLDTDPSQDITTPKPKKKIGHPKTDPKSLDDKELAQHVKKLDHLLFNADKDFGHKKGAQDTLNKMHQALTAAEKELEARQGDGQHPMDKDYDPAEDPVRAGYDTARDRLSNPDADKGVDAITQDIHNVPDGIDKKEFYKGYMKAVKDYKSKGKSEPTTPEPEDESLGDLAKRYEKLKNQQQQMIQKAKKALDQNDKEALASLEKVGKQIKNDLKSVKDKIKAKKKGSDIEYPEEPSGIGKDPSVPSSSPNQKKSGKSAGKTTNIPGVGPVPRKEVGKMNKGSSRYGLRMHYPGLGNESWHNADSQSQTDSIIKGAARRGLKYIWPKDIHPRVLKRLQKSADKLRKRGIADVQVIDPNA